MGKIWGEPERSVGSPQMGFVNPITYCTVGKILLRKKESNQSYAGNFVVIYAGNFVVIYAGNFVVTYARLEGWRSQTAAWRAGARKARSPGKRVTHGTSGRISQEIFW